MRVPVICDLQASIRQAVHEDPSPAQQLARAINEQARALHVQGINLVINWVLGHPAIPGHYEADRQANMAPHSVWYTVCECIYSSAKNRARQFSQARMAVKAMGEAMRCSKHKGNRLKGKAGSKRPVPMKSVMSLAGRFYGLKSWCDPSGAYLKRFVHHEADICCVCGDGAVQMREHLLPHCSQSIDRQKTLMKAVRKAKGRKRGRC